MKRLPGNANNDYTVKLGFSYSNKLRTRGHYRIHILDALGRDVDLGISRETSDEYYADNNKAIKAAQAVAERFGLPLDLNGFEEYNDSFGKIDTARVSTSGGNGLGAFFIALFWINAIFWGGWFLIHNALTCQSTLITLSFCR